MAGSLNKVILIGNLGADPEIKTFQQGGRIANLRLATTEQWKDRQSGERKTKTEWHSVVIGGDGLVGIVERFLRKGSKICVEGKLTTRKWSDQNGNDRYSTEVRASEMTMLDAPSSNSGGNTGGSQDNSGGGWDESDPPF